jgi:hypothetical protein
MGDAIRVPGTQPSDVCVVDRGAVYRLLTDQPDNRRPLTLERNRIDLLLLEGPSFECPLDGPIDHWQQALISIIWCAGGLPDERPVKFGANRPLVQRTPASVTDFHRMRPRDAWWPAT